MIFGSTPACAHDTIRAIGVLPSLAASLAFISTTAAAPSLIPDALPAVTVPSLSKAGRSLLIASSVVPCLGYSAASTTMAPLRVLTVTGCASSFNPPDFILEPAGLLSGLGLVLGGDGESILLLPRDLPLPGDVLGGRAHVIAIKGVPQAVLDHRVDHFEITHLHA